MLYQTKNPHGGDIYDGEIDLDFSANTNPFGTPEGVLKAVEQALPQMHRYPDPYCRRLVAAIAEFEGVDPSCILCGNGAAELIYAYAQAVHPKTAVELAPTFSEYSLGLSRVNCVPRRYLLRQEDGFALTENFLTYLEENRPEAVFLCNPNNPTGQLIEEKLLLEILAFTRERGISLFIDECFLDLSEGGRSLKGYLSENPQLFILKAFTKSYGMAGIRLGYCMCANPQTLGAMAQAVQPWNVSSLAQAAGIAALKEEEFLKNTKLMIHDQRAWPRQQLECLGCWVSDSRTNYLLFSAPAGLDQKLRQRRIAIRSCENYHGLEAGWYRIAVRQPEENRKLMAAIVDCLK